jgi:AraC-like DNA-binding protein
METNISPGHVGGHGRSGSTVEVSEPQMSRSGGLQSWQERQLREYIEANLDTKLLAVDLGRIAGLSVAYFTRVFKRTFGRTPHAYVMDRRIELARVLMLRGDSALSDIAVQCGFADQPHFCKHFRHVTGVTPGAWRREFVRRRGQLVGKPHASWPLAAAACGCLSLTLSAVATQIAPPADTASADGAAGRQRVLVQVPAATLDGYAGYYGYGGGAFVTVKHVDQHLTVEFSGTRSVQAVYPESATTFFYVDRDAQIRFSSDPGGQVATATILQNGASTPMSRIDAAAVQGLQASLDAKVQGQTPSQGSEAMLRRLIAGINAGKPNLEEMNPQLAAAIGKDLPKLQVKLADLGPVQSIQLLRVTQAGMDVYKVEHDRGSSEWSIELSPAGTLVGAMVP